VPTGNYVLGDGLQYGKRVCQLDGQNKTKQNKKILQDQIFSNAFFILDNLSIV
jgi:hypothetical protein